MHEVTRRRFLQYGVGAGAALTLPWASQLAWAEPQGRLAKYVDPLPLPGDGIVVATPAAAGAYSFTQREISRRLHRDLPPTPLWAYDDGSRLSGQAGSFGMAIVARRGDPLDVTFSNDLPASYPDWIPVDTRLTPFGHEVRVLTHLHGGFVDAASDGNPAATPELFKRGQTQTVHYPNEQPASLLWFHDHGLGTTRLNVFAGLAAGYLLYDQFDTGDGANANGLPAGPYEIPLVVQDRLLDDDGTMVYPISDIPGVTWVGEYFGDHMLVNGKVWPYLDVEPRLYRFRVLNGCNARILNLGFGGAPMWQIGAEGGLFDQPVAVTRLVMTPAERADVLVDFSGLAGTNVVMKNARPPRPVVTPAPPLPQVMQFRVAPHAPIAPTIPATLEGGIRADLPDPGPGKRRFIALNEVDIDTADWRLTLNGQGFMDGGEEATDRPAVGDVEEWWYINLTGDTHPMHTHLVMFQVVGRIPFDDDAYMAAEPPGPGGCGGIDPTPFATGPMQPPAPTERGFKDTVKANPGYVTVVRARFDLPPGVTAPQSYVHHCHIVEHEDNDMMRRFVVTP
jgi:spore coat protein A